MIPVRMGDAMEKSDHNWNRAVSNIDRRTALKGIGAMGVASVIGTTTVAADAGAEECDCPAGTVAWGKYEFVDCDFEFEKGDSFELGGGGLLVEITDWESKEGEECEPISVEYEAAAGYAVTHICAFGGNDTDTDDEPDGTYESDLENNGGKRAAISHITLCVEEDDAFGGYQVDLIHGEPIEQFDPDGGVTYNDQNRLLQAYWSGDGLENNHFHSNPDDYEHCWDNFENVAQSDAIPTSITVSNGTATACVDPDDADCLDDFALVSYGAPSGTWDEGEAPDQELWDSDEDGVLSGGVVCFEVELPPVDE